jgi:hypothetical protein
LTDADRALLVVRALVKAERATMLLGALCAVLLVILLVRGNSARLLIGSSFIVFVIGMWMTAWFPPWSLWPYSGAALVLSAAVFLTARAESFRARTPAGNVGGRSWLRCELIVAAIATAIAMVIAIISVGRGIVWSFQGTERVAVLYEMHIRPGDPWPRGSGHVVLGSVGSGDMEKAHLEPGGSFSPAYNSFGMSLWIFDGNGRLIATSDSLPLAATRQTYGVEADGTITLVVETNYYRAVWAVRDSGVVDLHLTSRVANNQHIEVAIRGVGPSAAPLREIDTDGTTVVLNQRWKITIPKSVAIAYMGREGSSGWTVSRRIATSARSADGWAHARLAIPANQEVVLSISDALRAQRAGRAGDLVHVSARPVTRFDPGDELARQFSASLDAQLTTLILGLVDSQTRPGNPIDYPLAWQRDGAYVIVALARAGQLEESRKLAAGLAEKDFFGGQGSEADAPGLALWALSEVSSSVRDASFDSAMWPHIVRKVNLILRMMRADRDIHEPFYGPRSPAYDSKTTSELTFIAGPSRNGLIDGKMDWERPVFFVNAVSYAGLMHAAAMAERLGHPREVMQWRAAGEQLKGAWQALFQSLGPAAPEMSEARTAIFGLWPAEIAPPRSYGRLLESRWDALWDPGLHSYRKRPLWTYFTLAEAHQWLRLGNLERCWESLRWFWDNQPAPGLYTQWEAKSESDWPLWRQTRGWVHPPYVSPHYWSAAEMLLLQLEMLAYVENAATAPVLVIGGGVPKEWLAGAISIKGIGTTAGVVDWQWDRRDVAVTLHGQSIPVRLGPNFPAQSALMVHQP